jgi:hypothetical protein
MDGDNTAFEVDDFGVAPIDALSYVENHEYSLQSFT